MSKVMAGVALVLLGGATVTGGVFLANSASSDKDPDKKDEEQLDYDLPEDLNTLKGESNREKCVTGLFGDGISLTEPTESLSSSDVGANFLGNNTTGCLVVNWNKKTKSGDSKWKGTFRFLWAVKGESKGFVVFLLGTTTKEKSGTTHKLSWTELAYLMEGATQAGQSNKTWTAKKKATLNANVAFSGSETDTKKFPGPGDALTEVKDKTFWGFFEQAADLNQVAEDSELTSSADSSMKGYWAWENGTRSDTAVDNKKKLTDWTKNIGDWWPVMFSSDVFKGDTKTEVEKHYGTWTKKAYEITPNTSSGAKVS